MLLIDNLFRTTGWGRVTTYNITWMWTECVADVLLTLTSSHRIFHPPTALLTSNLSRTKRDFHGALAFNCHFRVLQCPPKSHPVFFFPAYSWILHMNMTRVWRILLLRQEWQCGWDRALGCIWVFVVWGTICDRDGGMKLSVSELSRIGGGCFWFWAGRGLKP